jgi:hypothetical protein
VDIDMDEDNDVHGTVFIIPKKGMDSIRIKVHDDIVRDVNIDKSIKNVKKTLQDLNIKINSDSIIKKVIIRLDNQTLKNLSRESEILNNSVLDSVKISVFNERMKNVTEHVKNIQDSVLNNLQIILNNYLPDVENVLDSIYENMDFDELNNMKVEVYDDSVDLENLNDEIEKNVNDKLKNLELNIEINNDSIYNFHNIPGIPDSIKSKMYQYKHKIKNNKHREEEKEKEEKENEEDDNN